MRIANPIYDVVFKYLLEDNEIAKLMLSTIIGEEIVEIEFRPQERITEVGNRHLTVYRMDFAATMKNSRGEYRQLLIEIQKAKLDTDIMRFRRYLGSQYRDPSNVKLISNSEHSDTSEQALPLLTIYFLGHSLEHTKAPVIYVSRNYQDLTTGELIQEKEHFIESLTHDSYVIQIPYLGSGRRSEVEKMLQVFDQNRIAGRKMNHVNKHLLEIEEEEIPERYRSILRRLQRAISNENIVETMDVEDDILGELQKLERKADKILAEKEKALAEKEQALVEKELERAEKEQALAEKEFERAEKERERMEKEKILAEKEQVLAEKERLLQMLKKAGILPF